VLVHDFHDLRQRRNYAEVFVQVFVYDGEWAFGGAEPCAKEKGRVRFQANENAVWFENPFNAGQKAINVLRRFAEHGNEVKEQCITNENQIN